MAPRLLHRRPWALLLLAGCEVVTAEVPGAHGADAGLADAAIRSPTVLVQRVTDGDTIVVGAGAGIHTPDGRPLDGERIRLLGVDAPELGRSGGPADCFAEQARAFVLDAVGGRSVTLEFDESRCRPPSLVAACRGDFGRLLAYVRYTSTGAPVGQSPSGTSVLNEDLLTTGHAAVLRGAERFRHRDSARYDELERLAARARVGLWACP